MKRLFTFVICLLSLQIITTNLFASGSLNLAMLQGSASLKSTLDTNFAHTQNQLQLNSNQNLTDYQSLIKHRLDSIKKDVPLDYNEFVQNYIDLYSHNRDEMGQVIGLSKYYFPIYEKVFREAGIPAEIEYLSIVESKLDPTAVSRVGATGPWQFMSTTAKLYGLNMDGYVDERRDPVRASYAAAAYLKDAYEEFGDWLLAIASYNCGKSNVENAMAKAGGATDYWTIRQYLPVETRNYVPAYIAVAYVMNYYAKQNIIPQPCSFGNDLDNILVDRCISLNSLSSILNIDFKTLSTLNPSYRTQMINGSAANPRRLIIPKAHSEKYAALYDALNNAVAAPAPAHVYYASYVEEKPEHHVAASYHTVKKGETLGSIADKYGVDISDLKTWNHLHHNKAVVGQKLKISAGSGNEISSIKDSRKINRG